MKSLVIYDSYFNNTETIAKEIGSILGARTIKVNEALLEDLSGLDLLIIGSPTRGFRPTKPILDFINKIPAQGLKDIKIAVFDTGVAKEDAPVAILKLGIKIFGYAAKPMAQALIKKGGQLIVEPVGFFVTSETSCVLKEGELDRARKFAQDIQTIISKDN